MGREEDPFLGPPYYGVPGGGGVGVLMEGGAGAGGTHDEPAVVRPRTFPQHSK